MAAKRVTSVKTLNKREEKFKIKFYFDVCDGKVNRIRCQLGFRWEPGMTLCKKFSQVWVSPG